MVNALHLFVLLTSVATGSSSVVRNRNAVDVLDKAYSADLFVRRLRSNVAMGTSDQVEERGMGFPASVEEVLKSMRDTVSRSSGENIASSLKAEGHPTRVVERPGKQLGGFRLKIRIMRWKLQRKTSKDVFYILGLKGKADLFDGNGFVEWATFVYSANKNNAKKTFESMYSVLSQEFRGDDVLIEHLLARLENNDIDPPDRIIVSGLIHGLPNIWADHDKTPRQICTILDLRLQGYEVFERPAFSLWASFVKKWSSTKGKDEGEVMVTTLLDYGFSEEVLAVALSLAVKSPDAYRMFQFLERSKSDVLQGQLKRWAEQNKTPKDIFVENKISDAGDDLFKSAAFSLWASYVKNWSAEEDINEHLAMLSILRNNGFSKDDLLKVILKDRESLIALSLSYWIRENRNKFDELGQLHQAGK